MKSINKLSTLIICCMVLYGFAPMANAAGFMYLDDIDGESQDPNHPGWIDVVSTEWSLDASAATDKRGSGGELSDIKVTIAADASSPYLALAAMQGKSFDAVNFDFINDEGQVVRTMRLGNVTIRTMESSAHSDVPPVETLSLNYEKIVWVAYPVDRSQAPTEFTWTRAGGN